MGPAIITAILADLDSRSWKARQAIELLTEIYGPVAETAPAQGTESEAASAAATPKAPQAKARTVSGRKSSASADDSTGGLRGRVLDIVIEAGPDGISPSAVVAAAKSEDWRVRLTLKELVSDGLLVTSGATLNKRYRTVKATAGDQIKPNALAKPEAQRLAIVLDTALTTGASYEARDLLREARKDMPFIELRDVEAEINARLSAKQLVKMVTGTGTRYRKAARP